MEKYKRNQTSDIVSVKVDLRYIAILHFSINYMNISVMRLRKV